MNILPPELQPRPRRDYFTDLKLRHEIDMENMAERHDRINLLFHPERVSD